MRVIPIGYAYDTLEQTLLQAKASCIPTHNHREAINGAQTVAATIFLAQKGVDKEQNKTYLEEDLADTLHNIPIFLADGCENFKKEAKIQFSHYNKIYKTNLLKELQ